MIVVKARLNTHTGSFYFIPSPSTITTMNQSKGQANVSHEWLYPYPTRLTLLWFHEVKPAPQGSANLPVPSVANVLALVLISFHKPIDCTKITPTTGTFLFCYIHVSICIISWSLHTFWSLSWNIRGLLPVPPSCNNKIFWWTHSIIIDLDWCVDNANHWEASDVASKDYS